MAPFATMILAVPAVLLEGAGVYNWFFTHQNISSAIIIILSSGVLAFCLNFSIFYVIHSTTAVTFNVAGNLKVIRSILRFHHVCNNSLPILTFLIILFTGRGCGLGFMAHLPKSNLCSECYRMCSDPLRLHILWLCEA